MPGEYLARGAEAILYRKGDRLIKERVEKTYRIPEIDLRLRKYRTQREAKIMENAKAAGVPVPRVYALDLDSRRIVMEYVEGILLKDAVSCAGPGEIASLGAEIGRIISLMHSANIIHNDLTTSNMILASSGVVFIDFGLGITSTRVEDKSMDLVVFKKALYASHPDRFELLWSSVLEAYRSYENSSEVLSRIAVIEKRARYV